MKLLLRLSASNHQHSGDSRNNAAGKILGNDIVASRPSGIVAGGGGILRRRYRG